MPALEWTWGTAVARTDWLRTVRPHITIIVDDGVRPFVERHADDFRARPDDGGDTCHCLHLDAREPPPVLVCCHCGELFVFADDDPGEHGPHGAAWPPPTHDASARR